MTQFHIKQQTQNYASPYTSTDVQGKVWKSVLTITRMAISEESTMAVQVRGLDLNSQTLYHKHALIHYYTIKNKDGES